MVKCHNPLSLEDRVIRGDFVKLEINISFYFSASGLQLFIAKDGTTALGSHEVKSQMPAGVFKQVVMEENNR